MAVSKRLRYEILRRDNHTCRYCGSAAPEVKLTVDHVVPTALGGADEPTNLVAACADCNSGKSASAPDAPLVDDVTADALRWAAAMKRAKEIQAFADTYDAEQIESVGHAWEEWNCRGEPVPRPADWPASVRQLVDAGLNYRDDFRLAIEIAMQAPGVRAENTWRYFCGVCWRRVEDRQRMAREIIEAGD